ncbi:hypothetical protein B0H63DRAFT_456165 [Podospora didyma]|uniref:Uncharacterized protein n=1 Tax=Podospora didyma TaxID=330526 RepID=A0AAE0N197_9PEZI|nr:hypothetical protein B0H63DRAFT_456165 [Podospora didyma]
MTVLALIPIPQFWFSLLCLCFVVTALTLRGFSGLLGRIQGRPLTKVPSSSLTVKDNLGPATGRMCYYLLADVLYTACCGDPQYRSDKAIRKPISYGSVECKRPKAADGLCSVALPFPAELTFSVQSVYESDLPCPCKECSPNNVDEEAKEMEEDAVAVAKEVQRM